MKSLFVGAQLLALSAMLTLPVQALPPEMEKAGPVLTPWQDVITGQIEAMRNKDAPAAFSYAGHGFQAAFPNAEMFFIAIVNAGYGPIMDSHTHSFGGFRMVGDTGVVQQVELIGNDQHLYVAHFQLLREEQVWRIQGVQLEQREGLAI